MTVGQGRVWVSVQPGFRAGLAQRGERFAYPERSTSRSARRSSSRGTGRRSISSCPTCRCSCLAATSSRCSSRTRSVTCSLGTTSGPADTARVSVLRRLERSERRGYGQPVDARDLPQERPGVFGCHQRDRGDRPVQLGLREFPRPAPQHARDGPLATISATATAVGLTRDGPGALPGEPQLYYPRGVRHFARVVAADDVQGAAAALMAKRLDVTRLYVLDDGEPYGIGVAKTVRRTAGKLGVAVTGSGRWDVRDRRYRGLARRIERSGADGVFLGGYSFNNGAALLRDLRAALGPRIRSCAGRLQRVPRHHRGGGLRRRGTVRQRRELSPLTASPFGARFRRSLREGGWGRRRTRTRSPRPRPSRCCSTPSPPPTERGLR